MSEDNRLQLWEHKIIVQIWEQSLSKGAERLFFKEWHTAGIMAVSRSDSVSILPNYLCIFN